MATRGTSRNSAKRGGKGLKRVKQAATAVRRTRNLPGRGWKSQAKAAIRKLLGARPDESRGRG